MRQSFSLGAQTTKPLQGRREEGRILDLAPRRTESRLQGDKQAGLHLCNHPISLFLAELPIVSNRRLWEQLYCSIPHLTRQRNARRESIFKIPYIGRRQLLVHHTGVKSREDRFDHIYVTRLNYCLFVFHDLLSLLNLALSGNRACLTM
jgi:hypothetical protein